jgi:hypothetical protein
MPSFFMATTIKVDGKVATFTWQADQLLDEDSLVDFYVPATNLVDTLVPESTVGTGGDVKASAPAGKAAK